MISSFYTNRWTEFIEGKRGKQFVVIKMMADVSAGLLFHGLFDNEYKIYDYFDSGWIEIISECDLI